MILYTLCLFCAVLLFVKASIMTLAYLRDSVDDIRYKALIDRYLDQYNNESSARGVLLTLSELVHMLMGTTPLTEKVTTEASVCMICLDSIDIGSYVLELPCEHLGHPNCMRSWLRVKYQCPLCRNVPLQKD